MPSAPNPFDTPPPAAPKRGRPRKQPVTEAPPAQAVVQAPVGDPWTAAPVSAGGPWASVAPIQRTAPPGIAVDKATGEILYEDDNETPYSEHHLLRDWAVAQRRLDAVKAVERDLRGKVVACFSDPNKDEGSETLPIDFGWSLRVSKKQAYKFISPVKELTPVEVVCNVLNAMSTATRDPQGFDLNPVEGARLAMGIVKWSADLSVKEYKALPDGYRDMINSILEIKPAAPTVELIPPKEEA